MQTPIASIPTLLASSCQTARLPLSARSSTSQVWRVRWSASLPRGAVISTKGNWPPTWSAIHAIMMGSSRREILPSTRPTTRLPSRSTTAGSRIFEQPPVTQGIIVLLAMNILKQFDIASLEPGSADLIHLQIEALKLAFEDRYRYLGDPKFVDVPMEMLLSDEHAREQAARIDREHAMPFAWQGNVQPDTTYMCVVDGDGNMVSYIHSLFAGCGVVMGDTGALMNNRMLGFNLEDGHPNCLAPGKRPIHTLNNYLVQKDVQPILVGGTPGAHWQVQTNIQILCNSLDFGMDPARASEAPRFLIGEQLEFGNPTVRVESRVGEQTLGRLEEMGHQVEAAAPWGLGGGVQLIARDPKTGIYSGATDIRRAGNSIVGY